MVYYIWKVGIILIIELFIILLRYYDETVFYLLDDKTKIINEIHLDEEILVKSKEKQKEGIQHENEVTGEKEGNKKDDKNGK